MHERSSGEEPIERASPSLRATLRWELDLGAISDCCQNQSGTQKSQFLCTLIFELLRDGFEDLFIKLLSFF